MNDATRIDADPFLTLPLDGVRAIEASAGTGKTYTLATLVVRLVVERGLRVGEILAVTFTEAATQELRSRIRARLLLAERVLAGSVARDASPEAALTHAVMSAHLARGDETVDVLRMRLHAASNDIDLAAIFTIHGFCARALREHALEAGHGFDAPALLTSDTDLRAAIAADLWRAHGVDGDTADDLLALWKSGHTALASDLSTLVREPVLRPSLAQMPDDPAPRLHVASVALRDAFRAHGDEFRGVLVSAVESKVLNGTSYKIDWIQALFDSLKSWCDAEDTSAFEHAKLTNLTRDTLQMRTSKGGAGRTPDSPICAVVPAYLEALAAAGEWQDARRVALLHRLRDDARLRIAGFKQQQRVHTYDDLIDRVADAIDGAHAEALVARLRAQYAVALVDEFQDTDARQWRIFERAFGAASGAPALFVIGDPKQAIYGFRGGDLETYLAARACADDAPPLAFNFRSRPVVLHAVAALYAQADASGVAPFVDARIAFRAVQPGGARHDTDYQRNGQPAPALTVWRAPDPPPDSNGKPVKAYSAGRSRELATQACVAAIHRVLDEARSGRATLMEDGAPRAVQPGDIAVLVRSHAEATRIRHALALAGIPAVAAGKQSLFDTHEARDVHALLLALLHGADARRLRMALSTVLVGLDAAQVAALDTDADAASSWQLTAIAWRERLQRAGPLALISDLCATQARRLLGLLDGERRLTNYLQLAELLQDAHGHASGLHGLVAWLEHRIASASVDDDSQLLRLESDARRVQVVTLHKSKGLEYPLVFLPFAAVGGKARSAGQHVTVSGPEGRALHWKLLPSISGWETAKEDWAKAGRAEDARLLYVALTRARDALWVATGAFYNHDKASIASMLARTEALAGALQDAVEIDTSTPPDTFAWLAPESDAVVPPARIAARVLSSDWWVHSFTQLAGSDAQAGDTSSASTQPVPGGRDEPAADDNAGHVNTPVDGVEFDPRFAGARFGVVLHDVLEHADFACWRHWQSGDAAPDGEHHRITAALARGGYAAGDVDDGVATLLPLAGHTLTAALPEGVRLCDVPGDERRAEIEFQFALAPTRVDALIGLLHRHGVLRTRQGFGTRRVLDGLMTGLIDLTYRHDARWYVLDYKSNRLPGYGADQLEAAMAHSDYDLQALIYTLALHRWLRFRLGDGYDYARDFGGVRYVFCRGLDPDRPGQGVHAYTPDAALVHALDALFAGSAA